MSRRGLKIAALVLSGGVLLQITGCGTLLLEQLLGTIVSNVLSALIQGILSTASTPT
jgi:hypothetical protein